MCGNTRKQFFCANKLRYDSLVRVTAVTSQLLLNDTYKIQSSQKDGSRTQQEIPETAFCKARDRFDVTSDVELDFRTLPFVEPPRRIQVCPRGHGEIKREAIVQGVSQKDKQIKYDMKLYILPTRIPNIIGTSTSVRCFENLAENVSGSTIFAPVAYAVHGQLLLQHLLELASDPAPGVTVLTLRSYLSESREIRKPGKLRTEENIPWNNGTLPLLA